MEDDGYVSKLTRRIVFIEVVLRFLQCSCINWYYKIEFAIYYYF